MARSLPLLNSSEQRPPRPKIVILGLLLLIGFGLIASTSFGEYPISWPDVAKTILGFDTGNPDHAFVVKTLRLPRSIVAILVGMALTAAANQPCCADWRDYSSRSAVRSV